MTLCLRPAAQAFDAIAPTFDQRFGPWLSVSAQRRAVRKALLKQFPKRGQILELGGGTGEDAAFLAGLGYGVLLTDPSPAMVTLAKAKLFPLGSEASIAAGEDLEEFASNYRASGGELFDGAFSNFAPLNCIVDLAPVARGLAQLLKPAASAMLVVFGTFCPGEIVTELLHGHFKQAFRRRKRGQISARLSKREFPVVYHRRAELVRTFAPWFALEKQIGIGITVPPSAAEPWISGHPRLLAAMEELDCLLSHPLAVWGDHILYHFRRTTEQYVRKS